MDRHLISLEFLFPFPALLVIPVRLTVTTSYPTSARLYDSVLALSLSQLMCDWLKA